MIVASGAQDTPPLCGDNDLPGVMSARAGLRLLRGGIAPAERVVLAGAGAAGDAFARAAGGAVGVTRVELESVLRVTGRASVRAVVVRDGKRERRIKAGALLVDAPRAPSFELAVQAGAATHYDAARGFAPTVDEAGRAAPGVWCAGEVAGAARNSVDDGERVARAVAATLGGRRELGRAGVTRGSAPDRQTFRYPSAGRTATGRRRRTPDRTRPSA